VCVSLSLNCASCIKPHLFLQTTKHQEQSLRHAMISLLNHREHHMNDRLPPACTLQVLMTMWARAMTRAMVVFEKNRGRKLSKNSHPSHVNKQYHAFRIMWSCSWKHAVFKCRRNVSAIIIGRRSWRDTTNAEIVYVCAKCHDICACVRALRRDT